MKWLQLFLQLLPTLVVGVEKVSTHLAGHDKKAAVQDALTGIAQGFSVVMPEQAKAATTAAVVANTSIDGVVQILNDAGVLEPHKEVKAVMQVANSLRPSLAEALVEQPKPEPEKPRNATAPGLHNLVPA